MAVSDISSVSIDASSAQQKTAAQKSVQGTLQANSALQTKISSSNTQISNFGKAKLTLDQLQAKAQALQNFNNSPNLNDLKVAVLGFVQAFNTVHTDLTKPKQDVASDTRTSGALSAVSNAVTGTDKEGTRTALEKLGITLQKDGTLSVNQAKLEKAFREDQPQTVNTLSELGLRVDRTAAQQLSVTSDITTVSGVSAGNAGARVNDLTSRVTEVDQQQKATQQHQDEQKNAHKAQVAQQASVAPSSGAASSGPAVNAVATYVGVATL